MSCDAGVFSGPELAMADMDCASSSSRVPGALDLNLNLGPPLASCDGLALQLAVRRHNSEGSVQVSRQNWPRFEPGMPGLPLASGLEDECPSSPVLLLRHLMPQEIDRSAQGAMPSRVPSQESVSRPQEFEPFFADRFHEVPPNFLLTQRTSRNPRRIRRLRRFGQIVTSVLEGAGARSSSTSVSTANAQIIGASGSRESSPIRRMNEKSINWGIITASRNMTSGGVSGTESTIEDAKETETGKVEAHFECNICLEMASEPVVTCCGHLFCWPCLYQWLHVHSSRRECPVCKGSLSDDVLTPIYGRGTGKVTEKSVGSIPPRPHAQGFGQERTNLDRLDGDVRMAGPEVVIERSDPERSNSGELILNRLRIAQRLQRYRVYQRVMREMRRATFRSPSTNGSIANSSRNSGQLGTLCVEQNSRNQTLTRMAIYQPETFDSLAVIQARLNGLRENFASMQRSVQIANFLTEQVGAPLTQEGINCRQTDSVWPRVPDSAEMQQASFRELHRALSGTSGPFDLEPGLPHNRKRRRLN